MTDSSVERTVSWGPRLVGILLLVGGGGLLLGFWDRYADVIRGPRHVTTADLAAAADPDALPDRWVVFQPEQIINTNVSTVEGTRFKKRYYYHLAQVSGQWVVVRAPGRSLHGRITAAVTVFDSEEGRAGTAEAQRQRPKARFLSYQLDTVATPVNDVRTSAAITAILLLVGTVLAGGLLEQRRYEAEPEPEPEEAYAMRPTTSWHW